MFEAIKHINSGRFISNGLWQHPKRSIASYELLFVIEGTVFIKENGTEYALHKNDILILEPNLVHYGFHPSDNVSFYWLHWTGEVAVNLPKRTTIEGAFHLSLLFKQLLYYIAKDAPKESRDYLTRLILAELLQGERDVSTSKTADRIAAWIKANRHLSLKASQVANEFGYHPDYLNRLFQKHFGKSTKCYIDEMRLCFMKEMLLNCDLPLAEIAFACGFSDYKYFLKFFKYHEGITPTEFCSIYSRTKLNTK